MRRLIAAATVLVLTLAAFFAIAGNAFGDDNGTCVKWDKYGTCTTWTTNGDGKAGVGVGATTNPTPTPAPQQGTAPTGGGSSNNSNPCQDDPGTAACQAFTKATACSAVAADWASGTGANTTNFGALTATQLAALNAALAASGCPAVGGAPAPPSGRSLAQEAYAEVTLPNVITGRYPTGTLNDGTPYAIVRIPTWFFVDPSSWGSLSKTVSAGGVSATINVRATKLSFTPGDGSAPVSCNSAGTQFIRQPGGPWVPPDQPNGCSFRYQNTTQFYPNQELTSTYTVTWQVTWTSTDGTNGTLPNLTMTGDSTYMVAEVQAVIVR